MKKVLFVILCILVFAAGLGVMFYPTVSNWLHEQSASYAIADYKESTTGKSNDEYAQAFAQARLYNATLTGDIHSVMKAEAKADENIKDPAYWDTFQVAGDIMGVIKIPSINVTLPIYHGTEESILQKGAGHLEGSALPTGDIGNNTVITGHTGLPTAHLFTDLDEMVEGDTFTLEILNETFTYKVCDIFVVLPSETEHLKVQPDRDLVTLVTCTPYGVNSHRLLLQAERVATEEQLEIEPLPLPDEVVETPESNALANLPILIYVAMGLGILFVIAIVIFIITAIRRSKGKKHQP